MWLAGGLQKDSLLRYLWETVNMLSPVSEAVSVKIPNPPIPKLPRFIGSCVGVNLGKQMLDGAEVSLGRNALK